MNRAWLLFLLAAQLDARAACPQPLNLSAGARLEDLAARYLGNARYAISIVLATNARTDDKFSYIANPDNLSGVSQVCIPSRREAHEWERSWQDYARAVDLARLPRKSAESGALLIIPADQPVDVVAWERQAQAARFRTASGGWVSMTPSETWVTVESHLQEFCQEFVRGRHADEAALTSRLEQRLGLPPGSGKTAFVRIRLEHPSPDVIFRPCVDPAADHAGCDLGPPGTASPEYSEWFYHQYYSSYGQSLISEFPWTSLGYTFDWAPGTSNGTRFARIGESEFVIREGKPIHVLDVVPTAQYCGL
jgi:hypothetical protein